jgi:hypothetical protein
MLALERWYYQFVRLTAKFKVGIMFTIVVASLQDEGKIKLEEVIGSKAHLNDVSQVFEMIFASIGYGLKGNLLGLWRCCCT